MHNSTKIQHHTLASLTPSEQRQFNVYVRVHRLNPADALRAIENERRRNALLIDDVVETWREQQNRRLVVGSHERA